MIPTQFVIFTISVIIGSAVLFRDFESANLERFAKFFGGCALTFLGVYLITSGRGKNGFEQKDGMVDDEEETIGLIDEESYRDESDVIENEADERRRSKASTMFDGAQILKGSGRSSRQQTNNHTLSPHTPLRAQSHASSTISSRAIERTEGNDPPLLNNPWRSREDFSDPNTRPKLTENTISSPLLPSETQRSDPRQHRDQVARHLSPPKADRPSSLSRNSMSRLLPGPLVSPLSSPLSAIVADSLRRGIDSPANRRPGISTLRKSRSQRSATEYDSREPALDTSPLKNVRLQNDASFGSSSDKPRSKSMSATLGQLFRTNKDRIKGKDAGGRNEN